MKVILSALWLLLCLKVMGQTLKENNTTSGTISGLITSNDSNRPMEGAVVTIKRLNDSVFGMSMSSDKLGAFKFDNLINGIYAISVKHIGYREFVKDSLVIDNKQIILSVEFKLNIKEHLLNEVVVEARKKAYIEQKVDRTIVNVSQLLSNTGVSAVEVLNNAPGVEVTDDAILLRGKQGVTIYIDGRQTFLDGAQLINYLKSLPAGTIEKLELMPIPPAKYHVEGNAGLINIITKKNHTNGFNGSLSASQGQGRYSKSNYNLNLNYKTRKINFFGNAGYSSNNSYFKVLRNRVPGFTGTVDNYSIYQDNFEFSNRKSFSYKFGLEADIDTNNTAGIMIDGLISPYHEKGNYLLQFNHSLPDSAVKTLSNLVRRTNDVTLNLFYQHKFKNEGELIRIDADYFNYSDNADQLLHSDTYLPEKPTLSNSYNLITKNPFKADVYSLKSDYETNILAGIKLSAGAQSIYSKRGSNGIYFNEPNVPNDSLTNKNTYKEYINAAYISLNKEFKHFSLETGFRFENSSSTTRQYNYAGAPYQPKHLTYNNFFPKIYAAYKLDTAGTNTINFAFDATINRPDYSDLNPFAFYFDRYTKFQGNSSLLPEQAINFDLSFTHSGNFAVGSSFSKGKNTIIQYYYVTGQSLIKTSLNLHSTSDLGIYTTCNIPVFKWWVANLFTELSDRMFKGPTLNNENMYLRMLSFQVSGNNQLKLSDGWSAELGSLYRTKSSFGQGYYMPIYRINAGLQKKILHNKGIITLSGLDILHSWKIKRDIIVNNARITSINLSDTQQANLTFTYSLGRDGKKHQGKSGLQTERSRAGIN